MAKVENKKDDVAVAGPNAEIEEEQKEKREIERLKYNVEKLSQELNTAVAELKRSIIDIRSAVSEIENPFNLLRVISSEKDLKKLNGERLPPGVRSLVIGKPEEKIEGKIEGEAIPSPVPVPVPKEEDLEAKIETKPELEERKPTVGGAPSPGTIYLDWVWSLLDLGFSPDDIRQLSQSYEHLGFLPKGCSEQIYSLAFAAEKAKSKGLTRNKLLLNMYKASLISGIGISVEDVKRLIAMVEGRIDQGER